MISYLQIDKLTKSFGDLVLFEDITFGVAQGQKIGLIAKNGTGKTTLLNIIGGKEDYDSGEVVFRITRIWRTSLPAWIASRHGIMSRKRNKSSGS